MRSDRMPLCAFGGGSASGVSTAMCTSFAGTSETAYFLLTAIVACAASAAEFAAVTAAGFSPHGAHCEGRPASHAEQPGGGADLPGWAKTGETTSAVAANSTITTLCFATITRSNIFLLHSHDTRYIRLDITFARCF